MSNNSGDQQLFSTANTLIKKRVKIFLPESIKGCSVKDTCKQEQKAAQTKVLCPKDATFVHSNNHIPLSATAKD